MSSYMIVRNSEHGRYCVMKDTDIGWVRCSRNYMTVRGASIKYLALEHKIPIKVARDYYKWGLRVWKTQKKASN